jgi:hypothetical protein
MKPLFIVMLILMFGAPAHSDGQGLVREPENGSEKTFYYSAKKLGIPILKATIRIGNGYSEQGKNLYKIEAQVISLKIPGFMFRMNNRFTSFIEMDSFSPLRYVKQIDQEGLLLQKKNYSQIVTFDSVHHVAVVEKKETGEKNEVFLPPSTYDPLALFARYLLKEDVSPDQEIRMSIYDGVKFREMVFHSKRARVKSKMLGEIDAFCLESITAFSSFGEKEGNIRIWYTANGHKVPIFLELDLPGGMVKFELEEMKEES